MNAEAQKRLRLMTFWLFGTVVIAWAGVLTYAYLQLPDWGSVFQAAWPTLAVVLVGTIAIYAIYRWVVLPREKA